jgi:hypothetical protein
VPGDTDESHIEVEPGDQVLQTLGLALVRRQNGRGELLPLTRKPPVTHTGLWHGDLADVGGDGTVRQMAVADRLASAGGIAAVLVTVNPVADFGLDVPGEQLLGALVKDVGPRPSARASGEASLACSGPLDLRAQAGVRGARRSDTRMALV